MTSFFKLGGDDVNIYGGGTLDGNGQVWYDLFAEDIFTLRPVLIGIDGLHNSILSNLLLRDSPEYYHFVANATNVIFDNINISGGSTSVHPASNTDGWDTYRSSDLVIQNSYINNQDGEHCIFLIHKLSLTIVKIVCPSSPIALISWFKTSSATDRMVSLLVPSVNMLASMTLLKIYMSTTLQCTTQL